MFQLFLFFSKLNIHPVFGLGMFPHSFHERGLHDFSTRKEIKPKAKPKTKGNNYGKQKKKAFGNSKDYGRGNYYSSQWYGKNSIFPGEKYYHGYSASGYYPEFTQCATQGNWVFVEPLLPMSQHIISNLKGHAQYHSDQIPVKSPVSSLRLLDFNSNFHTYNNDAKELVLINALKANDLDFIQDYIALYKFKELSLNDNCTITMEKATTPTIESQKIDDINYSLYYTVPQYSLCEAFQLISLVDVNAQSSDGNTFLHNLVAKVNPKDFDKKNFLPLLQQFLEIEVVDLYIENDKGEQGIDIYRSKTNFIIARPGPDYDLLRLNKIQPITNILMQRRLSRESLDKIFGLREPLINALSNSEHGFKVNDRRVSVSTHCQLITLLKEFFARLKFILLNKFGLRFKKGENASEDHNEFDELFVFFGSIAQNIGSKGSDLDVTLELNPFSGNANFERKVTELGLQYHDFRFKVLTILADHLANTELFEIVDDKVESPLSQGKTGKLVKGKIRLNKLSPNNKMPVISVTLPNYNRSNNCHTVDFNDFKIDITINNNMKKLNAQNEQIRKVSDIIRSYWTFLKPILKQANFIGDRSKDKEVFSSFRGLLALLDYAAEQGLIRIEVDVYSKILLTPVKNVKYYTVPESAMFKHAYKFLNFLGIRKSVSEQSVSTPSMSPKFLDNDDMSLVIRDMFTNFSPEKMDTQSVPWEKVEKAIGDAKQILQKMKDKDMLKAKGSDCHDVSDHDSTESTRTPASTQDTPTIISLLENLPTIKMNDVEEATTIKMHDVEEATNTIKMHDVDSEEASNDFNQFHSFEDKLNKTSSSAIDKQSEGRIISAENNYIASGSKPETVTRFLDIKLGDSQSLKSVEKTANSKKPIENPTPSLTSFQILLYCIQQTDYIFFHEIFDPTETREKLWSELLAYRVQIDVESSSLPTMSITNKFDYQYFHIQDFYDFVQRGLYKKTETTDILINKFMKTRQKSLFDQLKVEFEYYCPDHKFKKKNIAKDLIAFRINTEQLQHWNSEIEAKFLNFVRREHLPPKRDEIRLFPFYFHNEYFEHLVRILETNKSNFGKKMGKIIETYDELNPPSIKGLSLTNYTSTQDLLSLETQELPNNFMWRSFDLRKLLDENCGNECSEHNSSDFQKFLYEMLKVYNYKMLDFASNGYGKLLPPTLTRSDDHFWDFVKKELIGSVLEKDHLKDSPESESYNIRLSKAILGL